MTAKENKLDVPEGENGRKLELKRDRDGGRKQSWNETQIERDVKNRY